MRKGYTFIELLVGITVASLIFSLGFVSFRDFSRRQALAAAARNIEGQLRFSQEMALAGEKPDNAFCTGTESIQGYGFRVVSSSSFSVEAVCTGGSVTIKSIDLLSNISLSTPTTNPIIFKVLARGTNIPSPGSETLTLTQTESGNTIDVVVNSSGEIE